MLKRKKSFVVPIFMRFENSLLEQEEVSLITGRSPPFFILLLLSTMALNAKFEPQAKEITNAR